MGPAKGDRAAGFPRLGSRRNTDRAIGQKVSGPKREWIRIYVEYWYSLLLSLLLDLLLTNMAQLRG